MRTFLSAISTWPPLTIDSGAKKDPGKGRLLRCWCWMSKISLFFLLFWAMAARPAFPSGPVWQRTFQGWLEGRYGYIHGTGSNWPKPTFMDIDADGDLDCFVGNVYDVAFYRNDGTAQHAMWTFISDNVFGQPLDSTAHIMGVGFADVDGDGDQDAFTGSRDGNIWFIRNDGSSKAPSWTRVTSNYLNVGGHSRPAFCDIDGDGDQDLFVAADGGLRFLRNSGTRTSPSWDSPVNILNVGSTSASLDIGDFDHDGDFDLLFGNWVFEGSHHVVYLRNDGTSSSPSWTQAATDFLPGFDSSVVMYQSLGAADLDADNDIDIVLGGPGWAQMEVYENQGQGTMTASNFVNRGAFLTGMSLGDIIHPAFGDLDDDGDLDLLIGNNYTGYYPSPGNRLQHFRNDGTPMEPNWHFVTGSYAGWSHSEIINMPALGDVDGDGDLDLFVGYGDTGHGFSAAYLAYYRNDGTRKAPVWTLVSDQYLGITASSRLCPTLADVDADGAPELFVGKVLGGTGSGYQLEFYENDGHGNFTLVTNSYLPLYPAFAYQLTCCPTFGDMDNDGDLDLLVGMSGIAEAVYPQVNFYRNDGTPQSPSWVLAAAHYEHGMAEGYGEHPVLADIDSDGDQDLFFATTRGGIQFSRNLTAALSIAPKSVTVTPGSHIGLTVTGATGAVWSMASNRSGAVFSGSGATASYTAGAITGVTDVIGVVDSVKLRGRAFVNVISPSQLSASGKAVVMAGRKASDPLWETTNNLAHFVYRTLLYRGFSKANVQYLNPDTDQDADGNELNDDIDAASSLANVRAALTTFVTANPTSNLFVYLIDHGDAEDDGTQGFVRCNESDVLTAAELDSLLDDLQQNDGVTTVTVVVDCCQSGSFVREVSGAPAGKSRVVVTACDPLQPAYFSAQGLVSFTNAFVSALYSGLPVGKAFDLAAGAMDRYQQPAMDDDGDGVYDKDLDGAIADGVTVGASFIAGADRPQIGNVSPNQTLSGGSTTATIWASDVSAVYPIDRVWATIAAPNFIPDSQLDPSQPVQNLPRLTLAWNAGASRYDATTDTFTMLGAYAVNIYAEDIWHGVSYPKQTYINQTQSDERIIIVCGDGAYDANSPWAFSDALAQMVYETARARWIDDAHISYLSAGAHSGVDGAPTQGGVESAIGAAAGIRQLTVYLVGAGNGSAFDINGNGPDAGDVTPAELDGWLDTLQGAGSTRVLAVLDFNQSGAWIAPLAAPAGKERIVIASCGASEESWCEEGGMISFSEWFFCRVFNGVNVRDAFNWARAALRYVTGWTQNPLLDDNGDGVANQSDGALAMGTYIGAAFVTGAEAPTIGDYARDVVLTSSSALLWASDVRAEAGIKEVFAYVVKPGSSPTTDVMAKVALAYNALTGRWEATYAGFDLGGENRVIYYAKDREDTLSEGYRTTFAPQGSGVKDWRRY